MKLSTNCLFLYLKGNEELFDNEEFWSLLPGDKSAIKQQSEVTDIEFEKSFNSAEISFYKYLIELYCSFQKPSFKLIYLG